MSDYYLEFDNMSDMTEGYGKFSYLNAFVWEC